MSERPGLQRQIEDLDRRLRDLDERIDDRQVQASRPQVWLAKTVGKTVSEEKGAEKDYPSGNSSTFGIKFRRPNFKESVGDQELEGPFGDDEPQRLAMTVPKRFISEDTDRFVVEIDGRFYFLDGGKETFIVELDDDLIAASEIETGSSSPTIPNTDCVRPAHQPATVWGYTDAGIFCPTGERIDSPEGVFNFQTDKTHKAKKSSGEPNLMLVYRESQSGKFVPECSTCDSPGEIPALLCDCLGDEDLCRVFIHFREVRTVDEDVEISGQKWPNYCNVICPGETIPPCTTCWLWNTPSGWELKKEIGITSTNDCRMGVKQIGNTTSEPFPATEQFPCGDFGDATEIIASFTCPSPTDGTGQATVDIRVKGCQLMTLSFDDIDFIADFDPDIPSHRAFNRVTRIHVPGLQFNNHCVCLIDTTRNDLFQGNFNADTGTPNLQNGIPGGLNVAGHNYIVTVAGTHDFGDGGIVLDINDTVVYDDLIEEWVVIAKQAGGAVDNTTFIPAEIVRFIDIDGCSWENTLKNARINLTFKSCLPP